MLQHSWQRKPKYPYVVSPILRNNFDSKNVNCLVVIMIKFFLSFVEFEKEVPVSIIEYSPPSLELEEEVTSRQLRRYWLPLQKILLQHWL